MRYKEFRKLLKRSVKTYKNVLVVGRFSLINDLKNLIKCDEELLTFLIEQNNLNNFIDSNEDLSEKLRGRTYSCIINIYYDFHSLDNSLMNLLKHNIGWGRARYDAFSEINIVLDLINGEE